MKPERDLTEKQFDAAMQRYGWTKPSTGFMSRTGYWHKHRPDGSGHTGVSTFNAGTTNRRKILAFMIAQATSIELRWEREAAAQAAKKGGG